VLINIQAITYHMLSPTDIEPQGVLLAIKSWSNPDQDFVRFSLIIFRLYKVSTLKIWWFCQLIGRSDPHCSWPKKVTVIVVTFK
jgi:hypothetical protein